MSAANNLTVTVDRGGPIQLQFFGNFDLGQVAAAEFAEGPRIQVASLLDLGGMKAAVVTQRAELKDYLDVYTLLSKAGLSLPAMLAAAEHLRRSVRPLAFTQGYFLSRRSKLG